MGMWDRATERLTLEPTFGPQPGFSPATTCSAVHPPAGIRPGSRLCCMVCHRTGVEHHPDLRETAADKLAIKNWKEPEGGDQWSYRATAEPTAYQPPAASATRRQRRAKQFRPQVERAE